MNAFANHDETWQALAYSIDSLRRNFKYYNSWKVTVLTHLTKKDPLTYSTNLFSLNCFYSDRLYQRHLVNSIYIKKSWIRHETIPKVRSSDLSYNDFERKYERLNKPVIIKGAISDWPAFKNNLWTRESILSSKEHNRENKLFACGAVDMNMTSVFNYLDQQRDDNPLFIFDPRFADEVPHTNTDEEVSVSTTGDSSQCAPDCEKEKNNKYTNNVFATEYSVPKYFPDDLFSLIPNRPNFRWLLLGGQRSGSKWHIDPNATSAWNAVVTGKKRWWMSPPHSPPPGVFPSEDGAEVTQPLSIFEWLQDFYEHASENGNMIEGTCSAGDLIFVPRGWWHAVLNLDEHTVAVTQNFVSQSGLNAVRRFLRFKSDQVSGVDCSRRPTLWKVFDDALLNAGIITADNSIAEDGLTHFINRKNSKRRKIFFQGERVDEEYKSDGEEHEKANEDVDHESKSIETTSVPTGAFWANMLAMSKN